MSHRHLFCLRRPNAADQARLFAVACIRIVGWFYSEPSESVVEMVECRDTHAPVPGDGFAEPAGVTHRDFQNIRKLCVRRDTASSELGDGLGRKFAVVEPFHEIRTSLESSAIEKYLPNLVLRNSLEHFYKCSFRLRQRKLSRRAYVKAP